MSKLGHKWQQYWAHRGRNGHDNTLIPQVDCCLKVYEVGKIDERAGTFHCVFVVLLDWLDPSLDRNGLDDAALQNQVIDFNQHFIPRFEIMDSVDIVNLSGGDGGAVMPIVRPKSGHTGECNHCTMSVKYSATLKSRFDFRHFPFETQVLQLNLKTLTVSDSIRFADNTTHGFVELKHPTRFRPTGHVVAADADWLADWDIKGLASGPVSHHNIENDGYCLQVVISRDARSIVVNEVFSLLVIDFMSTIAYGVPPGDLADRTGIVFTMLLTAMAFKFVLADQLPSVPYLTVLDWFVLSSFGFMFLQAMCHWVVAEFDSHLCWMDGVDFMDGSVDSGHPNASLTPGEKGYTRGYAHGIWKGREYPHNPTPDACLTIHLFDRVQLFVHMSLLMVKYASIVYMAKCKRHQWGGEMDGKLRDLTQLAEFRSENTNQSFERETYELSNYPLPNDGASNAVASKEVEMVEKSS